MTIVLDRGDFDLGLEDAETALMSATRIRHQTSQVVDLYRYDRAGCDYSKDIWGSWLGFLTFSAASTVVSGALMVEIPAIGAARLMVMR